MSDLSSRGPEAALETRSPLRHVPVRFGLTGVANTFVGLGVIYLAKFALMMEDVPANMLGYAVGLGLSFGLNKNWTFRHQGPLRPALGRFLVVQVVAYCLNLATVLAFLSFGINGYVSQITGIPVYMVVGYLGCRYWAFRDVPMQRC